MQTCDVVFLSLPSGEVVHSLAHQTGGLLEGARDGQVVVDLSTSPVDTTRTLAAAFASKRVTFIDAPVARTRAAAEAGTLSVMVGADAATFERVKPLIATFATDIALCGPVGCGQVVKILNNMVLFETVVALSEAKAIGERAGVDAALLFDTLSKGSADSFALRSHGLKSMIPESFPERAFSVRYARKDLMYALKLAEETGVDARGARNVDVLFEAAIAAGKGDQYHPVISQVISAKGTA
jgi:3-hydroxyisobutyrate dehydrogenase-like beta-hydroxyacid dehydrogenase